jgi:CheY-like chemotaxis protein
MTNLSSWNVLVVEDEVDAQDVVRMILQGCGAQVFIASSAEEALKILPEHPSPTVAVIDLALPNMNGWELLTALRSSPALSGIPAVAVTAYHSTVVAREAIQAGFAAYFPKPINSQTFAEDLVRAVSPSSHG